MKDNLPVYKISINPELAAEGEHLGYSQIAYTATPAIMAKGVAFNKATKRRFTDALKLRLAAPILVPNLNIYRQDDELGEYYVVFTEERIQELVKDFVKQKYTNIFNLDHDETKQVDSSILESWFVEDPETDKSVTVYGLDPLPKGSYFVVSQFWDEKYFQKEIIDKDRTGYSIEGFLGMEFSRIEKQLKQNKYKMKEEIKTADGRILFVEDGKIISVKQAEETVSETTVTADVVVLEEGPKDEVLANEEVLADAPTEEVAPAAETPKEESTKIDDAAIMAVVQPVIDDLVRRIADLQNMLESDNAEDVIEDIVMKKEEKMSAIDSLQTYFYK